MYDRNPNGACREKRVKLNCRAGHTSEVRSLSRQRDGPAPGLWLSTSSDSDGCSSVGGQTSRPLEHLGVAQWRTAAGLQYRPT